MSKEILFPVGRLVGGSLYEGKTTNDKGEPLVFKSGKNAGQPRTAYNFGVAYKKGAEKHWNETIWGKQIWVVGAEAAPKFYQGSRFAWKVTNGDSTEPNNKGNIPCEREGYPGHWVLWFSGNFAPNVFDAKGTRPLTEVGMVKPGHFIQVFGEVDYNNSGETPGVYLNFRMVAHSAYGPEIVLTSAPDASAVGFGQDALPEGATDVPAAGMQDAPPPAPVDDVPPPPVHTDYMESKPFPPEGWKAHPKSPGWFYEVANATNMKKEAELRALFA